MNDPLRDKTMELAMQCVADLGNRFGFAADNMLKAEDKEAAKMFVDLNKYIAYAITLLPHKHLSPEVRKHLDAIIPIGALDILLRSALKNTSDVIDVLNNPAHQREEQDRKAYNNLMIKNLQELIDFMQPWYTLHRKLADEITDKFGDQE